MAVQQVGIGQASMDAVAGACTWLLGGGSRGASVAKPDKCTSYWLECWNRTYPRDSSSVRLVQVRSWQQVPEVHVFTEKHP